jgi:uroporphyrin-III C-methyltransferase
MASPPALLTAVDSTNHIHLIVGSNPLAGARCNRALQVGAVPKIVAPADAQIHYALAKKIEEGKVEWLKREFRDSDLTSLGRDEVDGVVDAVFVTTAKKGVLSTHISTLCRRLRIPVNVADAPNLCTFTLLSTHTSGPLQIGVTTSGKGCKLASRIRREIASALPSDLGAAVERLGFIRRRIWEEDHANELSMDLEAEAEDEDAGQNAYFNRLITPSDLEAARNRRMRWLSQICEYWPLRRLAAITDADVDAVLASYSREAAADVNLPLLSPGTLDSRTRKGRIVLAGSGPGHPDLLTGLTLKAIRGADVILADKLVPAPVLDLIPRRTPVHIARKFPGNAEAAQEELLSLGLAAARKGQTVLRLKQGDPYLYGRGAEEFDFFRREGFEVTVLPGITSALSAPLFAKIPVTHRAVSDQVLICTGTGRKGAAPDPPVYLSNQTCVFLMSLHRLGALIDSLVAKGKDYPKTTPCAVIERASCTDQRVIRSTLEHVCAAIEEEGSRPPGLLVVGLACEVLEKSHQKWVVEEGFTGFDDLDQGGLDELGAELQGAIVA